MLNILILILFILGLLYSAILSLKNMRSRNISIYLISVNTVITSLISLFMLYNIKDADYLNLILPASIMTVSIVLFNLSFKFIIKLIDIKKLAIIHMLISIITNATPIIVYYSFDLLSVVIMTLLPVLIFSIGFFIIKHIKYNLKKEEIFKNDYNVNKYISDSNHPAGEEVRGMLFEYIGEKGLKPGAKEYNHIVNKALHDLNGPKFVTESVIITILSLDILICILLGF